MSVEAGNGSGGGSGIGAVAKKYLWTTPLEFGKQRGREALEGVRDAVVAPIAGLIDATRAGLDNAFVKPIMPDHTPMPGIVESAGSLVTQPLLRFGRATRNLLTLRPLKAAAELGAAALVDIPTQGMNLIQAINKWVTDQVKVVIPGLGRAVIGAATATDVTRLATTPVTKTISIPTAFGAVSPPPGPTTWGIGGGTAPAAAH